jgi:tetratricopeptide (TPR) repeat protein
MNKNNLLRVTFFAGLFLLLIIGALLAGTFVGSRGAADGVRESAFHRLLREYDFKYRQIADNVRADGGAMRRQEFDRLDSDLDRLEKQAEVVESWLSVLKRRRQLAALDPRYEESYRQSSRRAAGAFPHSEPIAAVAAAALVHNAAITRETEAHLREALPLLAGSRFVPLRLSFHVLLGDFKSPEQALASLPRDFTASEFFTASDLEHEVIYPDLTILKILAGDIPSAAIDIQTALDAFPSPGLIRLAAEYFFDFGDLLRAAELFSQLPDEEALSRQADALWLAGYTDNARAVWAIQTAWLVTGAAEPADMPLSSPQNRPLYNLALSAPTQEEETALLERLVAQSRSEERGSHDAFRRFGLIHLSRLLDAPQAAALLGAEKGADPLVGLETVKRRAETEEVARVIADTWLLLGRYPETEYLYEWGAWYFDLYRNYPETALLLRTAVRQQFTGYWVDFHQALQHIREGNLNAAADLLTAAAASMDGDWVAMANLGRVLEASLAPARAMEQYERALAVVIDLDEEDIASRIQVRIANCLRNMGRLRESRQALEYALELNPDNLTARLELNRLDQ